MISLVKNILRVLARALLTAAFVALFYWSLDQWGDMSGAWVARFHDGRDLFLTAVGVVNGSVIWIVIRDYGDRS